MIAQGQGGFEMKVKYCFLVGFALFGMKISDLFAIDQILYFKVPTVSALSLSGNVNFPDFATPIPGQNFAPLTDSSTTYSLSLNGLVAGKKITGRLAAAAPAGVGVSATLAAPNGASNYPATILTTTDQTLVFGIGNGLFSSQGITYKLSADMATTPSQSFSVTVTYTLLSGT